MAIQASSRPDVHTAACDRRVRARVGVSVPLVEAQEAALPAEPTDVARWALPESRRGSGNLARKDAVDLEPGRDPSVVADTVGAAGRQAELAAIDAPAANVPAQSAALSSAAPAAVRASAGVLRAEPRARSALAVE